MDDISVIDVTTYPTPKVIDPWNMANREISKEETLEILSRYGVPCIPPQDNTIDRIGPYRRACIHKSYMARTLHTTTVQGESVVLADRPVGCMDMQTKDNNTPEFVGDSILGAIVADYLKMRFPDVDDEGWYTKIKTRIVNNKQLGKLAIAMGMRPFVVLSRVVEESGGRNNLRILGSMLEAWIDCIYEDFNHVQHPLFEQYGLLYSTLGFPMAQQFVINLLEEHLDFAEIIADDTNYKDQLLKLYQARYHQPPRYKEVEVVGPPHDRVFTMGVLDVDGNVVATATARKKQEAEQEASRQALLIL